MRSVLMVLATAAVMALLACEVALADSVTTTFETFKLGTVNGQGGWKSAPPGSDIPGSPTGELDQAVVRNGAGAPTLFGSQSLRMSNAYTTAAFDPQTYSTPVVSPAGENGPNTDYVARFSFVSTSKSEQPGFFESVSPDSYEGSRMSWIGLEETPGGVHATITDTPDVNGDFVTYDAGTYDPTVMHTVEFRIKVNPGPDNDVAQVSIDGVVVSPPCFKTWENYYRVASEQAPAGNQPPDINSLQFRLGGTAVSDLAGHGYLFDNVTVTTDNGPGPAGCGSTTTPPPDLGIGKHALTKFVAPGHLVTYRITLRNRGRTAIVGARACDQVPRALKFVRARPRLVRVSGRRLCLTTRRLRAGGRRTIRATFRLRAGVTADTVTNGAVADVPIGSVPAPPVQPTGEGRAPRRRRVARTAETIGVLKACGASADPRAHKAC